MTALLWINVAVGLSLCAGTLLSFSSHPHWLIRGWDFPRVQIAALAALSCALHAALFLSGTWWDWTYCAATLVCVAWQCYRIRPYTRLHSVQVQLAQQKQPDTSIRLLICNVQMENRRYDAFVQIVGEADPDVVLAIEVNQSWNEQLKKLEADYQNVLSWPQENYYGMVLLSKLPLHDAEVRFLVQDDIPSIRAFIELPCGQKVRMYGLHPRPPEPIRDQDAAPRDAELVLVGREIEGSEQPTIVAGDLNDVAWSPTSELFLRLSGLVDSRIGRGMYNTWNATNSLMRFPLDHVFHSHCFRLIELRRLRKIGSDHFPVLISLSYEPAARGEQPKPAKQPGDAAEAQEKLDREGAESRKSQTAA